VEKRIRTGTLIPGAQPYVDAAFTLARGVSAVVLDLRDNGGGDPATVARVAGLLLGDDAVHL
jgi:C-terminal processing protease CtpA/Prc